MSLFLHHTVATNIVEGNCQIMIGNGHHDKIHSLVVHGKCAVTAAFDNIIRAWDLDTAKAKWGCAFTKHCPTPGSLKIVDNQLVYSYFCNPPEGKGFHLVTFINLQTGYVLKQAKINDLFMNKIEVIGNHIFGKRVSGEIGQYNQEGYLVKNIETNFPADVYEPEYLTTNNSLVAVAKNHIFIHKSSTLSNLTISGNGLTISSAERLNQEGVYITSCSLEDSELVCCVSTSTRRNVVDCCIVDLFEKEIITQYRIQEDEPFMDMAVLKVIRKEEKLYLGCASGKVIAVDIIKKNHIVLGSHACYVSDLALDNGILASISNDNNRQKGELKLWNAETHALLKTLTLPGLGKLFFNAGIIQTIVGSSLIQWNYDVSQKGVKFAENSALAINSSTPIDNNIF